MFAFKASLETTKKPRGSTMSKQAQATSPATQTQAPQTATRDTKKMKKYLDSAMDVLKKFGIDSKNTAPQELISLLESVKHIDEAKVLAIADVIQHMSSFNALVRENVESIKVGDRYMTITQMFDSVRNWTMERSAAPKRFPIGG